MVFKYQYTINGEVMPAGTVIAHQYTGQINKPCLLSIELPMSALETYSINNGNAVLVQYGKTTATDIGYLFRGTIENIKEAGTSFIISCLDKLYQLEGRLANEVYKQSDVFGGDIQTILIDLIQTYGGLTATTSTIQDTSEYEVKEKYVCFDAIVIDKVKELCDVLAFIFYYDSNEDKVYAHEKGYYINTDTFQTGVNITNKPIWNKDSTNIINYLSLYGSTFTAQTVDYFSGDGVTDTFTLSYAPDIRNTNIMVEVYVGAAWVEQVYGNEGTTTTYDYTLDSDPSVKAITFVSGSIPGNASDNIKVTYAYTDALSTERINDASKDLYPASDDGYRYRKLTNTSIITSTDLENIADTIIDYFGDTYDTVNFSATLITDFPKIGYLCTINDTMNNENRDLIISGFSFKYPADVYNIQLSEPYGDPNELLSTIDIRLKKLEEENIANSSVVKQTAINDLTILVENDLIVSDFNVIDDVWNDTETWDDAEYWSINPSKDDFSLDLSSTRWDDVLGTWTIANGVYTQSNSGITAYTLWNLTNYTMHINPDISVKIKKTTNHFTGVLFRFNGTNGYCIRYKDASHVSFGTFNTSTGFTEISEHDCVVPMGVWHHWRIVVESTGIAFMAGSTIDDEEVILNTTDTTYASGSVGLITFNSVASFDTFEIGNVDGFKMEV